MVAMRATAKSVEVCMCCCDEPKGLQLDVLQKKLKLISGARLVLLKARCDWCAGERPRGKEAGRVVVVVVWGCGEGELGLVRPFIRPSYS